MASPLLKLPGIQSKAPVSMVSESTRQCPAGSFLLNLDLLEQSLKSQLRFPAFRINPFIPTPQYSPGFSHILFCQNEKCPGSYHLKQKVITICFAFAPEIHSSAQFTRSYFEELSGVSQTNGGSLTKPRFKNFSQ